MKTIDRFRAWWQRHDERLADDALRGEPQTDPLDQYERDAGVEHAPYRESDDVERRLTAEDE